MKVTVESDKFRGYCMEGLKCKEPIIAFEIGSFELRLCKEHSRALRNGLSEAEAEAKKREAP